MQLLLFGTFGIIFLILSYSLRDKLKRGEWKIFTFVTIFLFPLMYSLYAFNSKIDDMKTVEFCGSCHTMEDYVTSLTVKDDEPLSSVHYRNNYVPKETACYSCHTSYAMFGGIEAKFNGLKHVYTYLTNPEIDTIKLYKPYSNNNCLHCHGTGERYLNHKKHNKEPGLIKKIAIGEKSCLSSGCHDMGHYIEKEDEDDEEGW